VTELDDDIRRLVDDMLETMYDAPGVGLAAPQIGVALQVVVYDIGEGPGHFINPILEETSGEWEYSEGCLSVPEKYWDIERPSYARIRATDVDGGEVLLEGDELMGRMLQHEYDHLQGMLLLERLSRRVRKQALKDLREEAMGLKGDL
jgi:peptide deformylase